MRCPACSAETVEQAVYCSKCGERLDSAGAPPPPTPQAEEATQPSVTESFKEIMANGKATSVEPEKELWRGGFSPKAMIGGWALSAGISLLLLVGGIVWAKELKYWLILVALMAIPWLYHAAILCYRRMSVHYQLTTQRFIHEAGVLRRVTNRIEVLEMDDITFEQTLLERLVGVGTIRILSGDRTDPQLVLRGIDNVRAISELLDNTRLAERRRRGVHIEQI